jgi:pumilio homology domain family member 6
MGATTCSVFVSRGSRFAFKGVQRKEYEYEVYLSLSYLIHSKKDIDVRRVELLDAVSGELLGIIASETDQLMRDPLAVQVVQEIILHARGISQIRLQRLTPGDKSKAVDAVISLASGDPSDKNHIVKLPFTARVYKTLVQGGHYNAKEKRIEGKSL